MTTDASPNTASAYTTASRWIRNRWAYKEHGRVAEAEPPFRRSLAVREKALGVEHPNVGESLNKQRVIAFTA
jgi:hypothetical protein